MMMVFLSPSVLLLLVSSFFLEVGTATAAVSEVENDVITTTTNNNVANNDDDGDDETTRMLEDPLQLYYDHSLPSDYDTMIDLNNVILDSNNDNSTIIIGYEVLQAPIRLDVSVDDDLIVLARRNQQTSYIPVSRSYGGYDWERVAGPDALTLDIECSIGKCILHLTPNDDDIYFLTKYQHIITPKQRISRFLEQATFGPTPKLLNEWDYSTIDQIEYSMASFVENEIKSKPIGSHREFFRQRLNNRGLETYKDHTVGPKPCDKYSRWRKFAFTTKDYVISNNYQAFDLEIITVNGIGSSNDTGYVLKFQNHIRTILVNTPIQYYYDVNDLNSYDENTILPDGNYQLCWVDDVEGSKRLESTFTTTPPSLKVNVPWGGGFDEDTGEPIPKCLGIVGGNPTVHLDYRFLTATTQQQPSILNLTDYDNVLMDLNMVAPGDTPSRNDESSTILLTQSIENGNDPICDTFPDLQDTEYVTHVDTNDETTPNIFTQSWLNNPTAPIFGLRSDGSYVLYDSRVEFDENTVSNPLVDGGAEKVVNGLIPTSDFIQGIGPEGYTSYYCANAQQTIFNEHGCKLAPPGINICGGNGDFYGPNPGLRPKTKIWNTTDVATVVCGSIGEVAPDVTLEDSFITQMESGTLDTSVRGVSQEQTIWIHKALYGEDQLRQRMAWALSMIFVIDPNVLVRTGTEPDLYYYDIFVRNGLGNYRDVMKEVAYSPKMGEMLTFIRSKSIAYGWHAGWMKQVLHPDENFARELMQLFTVGLVELNIDGTTKLDRFGIPIKTYDSQDIVSFARAWTGFDYVFRRGNNEDLQDPARASRMDPMDIPAAQVRDWFPKRGLDGKYIGDRYPWCEDLPSRAFLKKDAKFRLLGGDSEPKWQSHYGADWTEESSKRFVLSSGSMLLDKLCAPDAGGGCTYPGVVVLDSNLECVDKECLVDTIRQVEVSPGIYYEYIRVPCVHQVFYDDAKKMSAGWDNNWNMCGNPKIASATEACCGVFSDEYYYYDRSDREHHAHRFCEYMGEVVTYATNVERCHALGGQPCAFDTFDRLHWSGFQSQDCVSDIRVSTGALWENTWHWTDAPCNIQILVQDNGLVALNHEPDKTRLMRAGGVPETSYHVNLNHTLNYFSVHWEEDALGDDIFPSTTNDCGGGSCELVESLVGKACLCSTTVTESPVFLEMPTREDVLSNLAIGAFDPAMFDDGEYVLVGEANGVEAWRKASTDWEFPPTPSPTGKCEKNLVGYNPDFETGTTDSWYNHVASKIYLESPGYGGSQYALKVNDTANAWTKGAWRRFPAECMSLGTALSISFKYRMYNPADGSSVDCNPHSRYKDGQSLDGLTCPHVQVQTKRGAEAWRRTELFTTTVEYVSGGYNTFTSDYVFSEEDVGIDILQMAFVVGGTYSDGRVLLIDDVQVFQVESPEPVPAAEEEESCYYINFAENGDAEIGSTFPWEGYGNSIGLVSPGYGSSSFAFKTGTEPYNNWPRGLGRDRYMEGKKTGCIFPGETVYFEYKVRLIDENLGGIGIDCNYPGTGQGYCPQVRPRILKADNTTAFKTTINGISSWNKDGWNTFSAFWKIPEDDEDFVGMQDLRPYFVANTFGEGIYQLLDDIQYYVIPSESLPSSQPSQSPPQCLGYNLADNGDAETGSTHPWKGWGNDVFITTSSYAGNYAFNTSSGNNVNWNRGLLKKDFNANPEKREPECISPGTMVKFEYKVRLVNETENGTVGVDCNIDGGFGQNNCPMIRLRYILSNGNTMWNNSPIKGLSSWNPDGWNSFSATYQIPTVAEEPALDGMADFIPNFVMNTNGPTIYQLLDDVKYYVISSTDAPSQLPTLSSVPSARPSWLPSLSPSYAPSRMPSVNPSANPSSSPSLAPTQLPEFTADTVFRVVNEGGEPIFLKNARSTVQVGDATSQYTIRNPVTFHDLADVAIRDAHYETEAVIDHLLYHDNTAPFVSKLLIQHFGISNPSPSYVAAVATAFQTGSYVWTDGSQTISFGDERWGDLAATAAAILLHREATSVVLDADPTHGSVRQPLNKVIGMMRSMDYTRTSYAKLKYAILNSGLQDKIGQMPYEAPDVFSFFNPLHSEGNFVLASLVSPESDVLSMVSSVSLSNGMYSLANYGMTQGVHGFGRSPYGNDFPLGYLEYIPDVDLSNAGLVVDDLSSLLMGGRLSSENRDLIVQAYNTAYGAGGTSAEKEALQVAQHLLVTCPEFHTTNKVRRTGNERQPSPQSGNTAEPYKAIVYVYLFGGMDSFYMLAPHSSCELYNEYVEVRGTVASLEAEKMLTLDASSSNQTACSTFGLHDQLPILKTMYDAGEGTFFANTGYLSKPVTKDNYLIENRAQLFSHHHMQQEAEYVDAFREDAGTGVLGRLLDQLQLRNYSVSSISIDRNGYILAGNAKIPRSVDVIRSHGIDGFYNHTLSRHRYTMAPSSNIDEKTMIEHLKSLNGEVQPNSGMFADHWSKTLIDSIDKAALLKEEVEKVKTTHHPFVRTGIGRQLEMVAKLMTVREARKVNRDAFYVKMGGFDTHSALKDILDGDGLFSQLNAALDSFYKEMVHLGIHDDVTLVLTSEFARTISPNVQSGTDHAWGGNYFMMGGSVNGGRILGEYPQSFDENDPTNDGRGRFIPTTSWDALWNGVSQWFGIEDDSELDAVLPNRANFGCGLFTDRDLFKNGQNVNSGCGGDVILFQQSLILSSERYLIGEEQAALCEVELGYITNATNATMRCFVVHQEVKKIDSPTSTSQRSLQTCETSAGVSEVVVTMEITSDSTGLADQAIQILNANKDSVVSDLQFSDNVADLVGVCDVSEVSMPSASMMPSMSTMPSSSPSTSAAPTTSAVPSTNPSDKPVTSPPTSPPTSSPTVGPTAEPTQAPTPLPTMPPTPVGTPLGSQSPGPSSAPSESKEPSMIPSKSPSSFPTNAPSGSLSPSSGPTSSPSLSIGPTIEHSNDPTMSSEPSKEPSRTPSSKPSSSPSSSMNPTKEHSSSPSMSASPSFSVNPSALPSVMPSLSAGPTMEHSNVPSISTIPSMQPSGRPSAGPTMEHSNVPSISTSPSMQPSGRPSLVPSMEPSRTPSSDPSSSPSSSMNPTKEHSSSPSVSASPSFSANPSALPSVMPSLSAGPTMEHSNVPSISTSPSMQPSGHPSVVASMEPSMTPTISPSTSQLPSVNEPDTTNPIMTLCGSNIETECSEKPNYGQMMECVARTMWKDEDCKDAIKEDGGGMGSVVKMMQDDTMFWNEDAQPDTDAMIDCKSDVENRCTGQPNFGQMMSCITKRIKNDNDCKEAVIEEGGGNHGRAMVLGDILADGTVLFYNNNNNNIDSNNNGGNGKKQNEKRRRKAAVENDNNNNNNDDHHNPTSAAGSRKQRRLRRQMLKREGGGDNFLIIDDVDENEKCANAVLKQCDDICFTAATNKHETIEWFACLDDSIEGDLILPECQSLSLSSSISSASSSANSDDNDDDDKNDGDVWNNIGRLCGFV